MGSRNASPPDRSASIIVGAEAAAEAIACANAFAVESFLSADATARLAIIVEELVLNLVDHGHCPGKLIGLELRHSENTVTLVLTDLGEPFDLRSAPEPGDLPPERGGGAGLAMIRAWATIDDYGREGDHNRLALTLRD